MVFEEIEDAVTEPLEAVVPEVAVARRIAQPAREYRHRAIRGLLDQFGLSSDARWSGALPLAGLALKAYYDFGEWYNSGLAGSQVGKWMGLRPIKMPHLGFAPDGTPGIIMTDHAAYSQAGTSNLQLWE